MSQDFNDWIGELKSNLNITNVISGYISLKKRGNNYWANCPFHSEKTPSFAVNESKQFFHCFGCGKSGDVITFVQDYENITFMQAIEKLASMAGMTVPRFSSSQDNIEFKKRKERLYEIMVQAARFYHNTLVNTPSGKKALDYLEKRNFSDIIVTFGLGASPDSDSLVKYLKEKGFEEEDMILCGVCEKKDGKVVDALAGRMIVPIINNIGKVVAFGGRILEDAKFAKYKNTKESPIFIKSQEIFGINSLARNMREENTDTAILVEGYMDVIALYQVGLKTAVASMGTSLTEKQAKILSRYSKDVVVSFDGDTAGQKATLRGLQILNEQGINAKVITIPNGLDPDDFIKKYSLKAYKDLLLNAQTLNSYLIDVVAKDFDLKDSEGRARYAEAAIDELLKIKSRYTIQAFLPEISLKSGIDRKTLKNMLFAKNKQKPNVSNQNNEKKEENIVYNLEKSPSRLLLFALFAGYDIDPQTVNVIISQATEGVQNLYASYERLKDAGVKVDLSNLEDYKDENKEAAILLSSNAHKLSKDIVKKILDDCATQISVEMKEDRIKELSSLYQVETDPDRKRDILVQIQHLMST